MAKENVISGCQAQIDQLNRMINVSNDEHMISVFKSNIKDREQEIAKVNEMSDEDFANAYPELIYKLDPRHGELL